MSDTVQQQNETQASVTPLETGSRPLSYGWGKIAVITGATYHEVTRQPVYYVLIGVFGVLIFLSPLFALFHFEEKDMVMELGIASLMAAGIFIAVVSAGFSISREMDKMVPFSILCKPVRRAHFLLGKFFGVYLAVVIATVFLAFMMILSIDVFRSSRELNAAGTVQDPVGFWGAVDQYVQVVVVRQMLPVLSAVVVTAFGLAIVTAFAVSVAVHFPLVVTGAVCLLVFILGNLAGFAMLATAGSSGIERIIAWACHVVLPNMGMFNMTNLVAVDKRIGLSYIGGTTLYSILYSTAVLLAGVAFFERKEIK
ncbi:MAG: hypothetical protein RDV41_15120 [Planctomycetota bacterium]|nr:hypothetical protein [Planctomycetota bacterium]